MMRFFVRYAGLWRILTVFCFACTRQKIDLENAPEGDNSLQIQAQPTAGTQLLPAVKTPRTEEERFHSLQVDGKDFKFFELSIPPSFLWQPEEFRLFSFLYRVVLAWEQASYRSTEERDAAFFFHSLLLALLAGEEVPGIHFRDIVHFALPLYVYKRILPQHKPALTFEDIKRLVQTLWEHGFNLNHVRQEELNAYLRSLQEMLWKERVFSPENPWEMMPLREDGLQLGRDDLAAVRRCATLARGTENATCVFGKYQLRWRPSLEGSSHLILVATLETGRGRDSLQSVVSAYQKRPGWFVNGMQFPVPVPQDDFVLAATGPLPLVVTPNEPPGNVDWPQNLRQSDWENMSGLWMEMLGAEAPKPVVRNCFPGILDAFASFLRYTHAIQGKPLERVVSQHLAVGISDADILERLWSYVWFVHAASTGHHTSLGIRSGCEGHVVSFLSLQLAWRLAAASQANSPNAEIVALRLFFGLLYHLRTTTRGEVVADTTKAVEVNPLSDEDFPELVQIEKVVPLMEAIWVLLSQPENFLLTMAPRVLAGISLLPQRDRLYNTIKQFNTYRVYLPALPRAAEDRISYRRLRDAVDYYLQLISEARRVKLL